VDEERMRSSCKSHYRYINAHNLVDCSPSLDPDQDKEM
jgi:hypothetical protein